MQSRFLSFVKRARQMRAARPLAAMAFAVFAMGLPASATNLLNQGNTEREWVETGDFESLRSYLIKGGDVAVANSEGITLLMIAAQVEALDILDLLLEFNANLERGDKGGNTALHWAILQQSLDAMEHLLSVGADPNRQNRNGETPLALAVRENDRFAVEIILAAGADPSISDYTGRSVMDLARQGRDRAIEDILYRAGAR